MILFLKIIAAAYIGNLTALFSFGAWHALQEYLERRRWERK